MTDVLDGKKLTYEELVELLCLMSVRLERLEKYVNWLNKEIASWAEFQTGEIFKTECNMQRYKVPFKKITELEESLKGYITFNESKQDRKEVPATIHKQQTEERL